MKTISYEKQHGTDIFHVDVSYEEAEVEAFREKLIKEACYTIHYNYKSYYGPLDSRATKGKEESREFLPAYTISNYKKTVIMEESKSNQKLLFPMCRYEYDVNYLPRLLSLINEILNGRAKAIEEIMCPVFDKEYIPIRFLIKDREEQYMNLNSSEMEDIIDRKIQILDEIRELFLKIKEGDYEIPILPYYEEAQHLFIIEKTKTHRDVLRMFRK